MKIRTTKTAAGIGLRACLAAVVFLAAHMPLLHAQDPGMGKPVPAFSLLDMRGHPYHYSAHSGKVTAVIFFSTRCPMSNAFNHRRQLLFHDYGKRVRFLVIDSNANESMEEERNYARDVGFDFPVYLDLDNKVADLLGARNTTETFVLDTMGMVRYRGYIEDAPNPERTKLKGLQLAIEAVLADRPVETPETRGIGCSIRRNRNNRNSEDRNLKGATTGR